MLKVFFGARAGLEVTAARIREYREREQATCTADAVIESTLREGLADRPEAPSWLLSLRCGPLLTEARLCWCDECEDQIRTLQAEETP